jgi:hypothetical protein
MMGIFLIHELEIIDSGAYFIGSKQALGFKLRGLSAGISERRDICFLMRKLIVQ